MSNMWSRILKNLSNLRIVLYKHCHQMEEMLESGSEVIDSISKRGISETYHSIEGVYFEEIDPSNFFFENCYRVFDNVKLFDNQIDPDNYTKTAR